MVKPINTKEINSKMRKIQNIVASNGIPVIDPMIVKITEKMNTNDEIKIALTAITLLNKLLSESKFFTPI